MIIKLRLGHWRFTFSFAPVVDVIGVNSKLPDGKHILMWDFDDIGLNKVIDELRRIQYTFMLPNIYILNTGAPNHYIAYSFAACSWNIAVEIIATTVGVDKNFFKYGVYREHFTLRVTPKCGRKLTLVRLLESDTPENCTVAELKSWVQYETLPDDFESRRVQLGEP